MSLRPSGPDYPWRLRIEHEGARSLRLDRRGRRVRIDPIAPPERGEIVVLTGSWPEQVDATMAAVAAGVRPTVVASEAILAWLGEAGELDGHADGASIDGVELRLSPYTPIPYATPKEAVYKVKSALLRPGRAAARLLKRARRPSSAPQVLSLRLADGGHFVHLGCALHDGTPADWLSAAVEAYQGADWLVLGVDHGHGDAVLQAVSEFGARYVLFTDLLAEVRQSLGLPTELLTPIRDRAVVQGIDGYVVVSGAGMRWE